MATVTKPPVLDSTGQDILNQLRRIADAKEANLMGYGGAVMFASLPNPTTTNLNLFYLIKDSFTSDTRFVDGGGVTYSAGKYFCVINIGTDASPVCKYDELGNLIDVSDKQDKTMSSAITVDGVTETTVEGALGAINTLAANDKTSIGDISTLTTTSKTSAVSAINELNSAKVNVNQGAANVGKILKVDSSGDLVISTSSDDDLKKASNTYSANAASCSVSIDLSDGNYVIEAYCTEEAVTKLDTTAYLSGVLTVNFQKKPTVNGTMWVVARKVV